MLLNKFVSVRKGAMGGMLAALFCILAALQLLDWHSTFTAINDGRAEQNGLILLAARFVDLKIAVSCFKLIAIAATFIYYKHAVNRRLSGAVLIPLFGLVAVYSAVVLNNYSH